PNDNDRQPRTIRMALGKKFRCRNNFGSYGCNKRRGERIDFMPEFAPSETWLCTAPSFQTVKIPVSPNTMLALSLGADMRRREFITLLAGATYVWPLAPRAQQPGQMRRIGVLMGYAESDLEAQAWVTAFVQGFKDLGWIVGRNVSIDYRFGAGDTDRMRA